MRRSTKRRLIPLALALALAMVGVAFAVPAINVGVQKVGGGANDTVRVDTTKAAINWDFKPGFPWIIENATVTLDQGPGVDATAELYVVLDNGTKIQKSASITSTATSVQFDDLNIDLTKSYITKVVLVIAGKVVTVS